MTPRLTVAAALLVGTAALAAPLDLVVYDPPQVKWDGAGHFIVVNDQEVFRGDVRTDVWEEVPDAEAGRVSSAAKDLKPSRTSPDGKSRAEVQAQTYSGRGTWKGADFKPPKHGVAELRVARGKKSTLSRSWNEGLAHATPYWSPDGRYIAWLLRSSTWEGMDGSVAMYVVIGSGGGARAQVLAAPDVLKQAGATVTKAVEAAGLTVVLVGKAQKPREQSVVYAAKGFEAAAKRAAAAVPGGATVEPLTWKPGVELVVALGRSALGGDK